MPLLAKQKEQYPMLADTESPCEKILSQSQSETTTVPEEVLPAVEQTTTWIKSNKSWLPWAIAAGFGLLWANKRREKQ